MRNKLLVLCLILSLCLVCFAGCGGEDGQSDIAEDYATDYEYNFDEMFSTYDDYDLSEYLEIPDYSGIEVREAAHFDVTDEEVEAEIAERLAAAGTTETITEGTVKDGDSIVISYQGTLEDGTQPEKIKSDYFPVLLGSGGMIAGFEEGLVGATIGEAFDLELSFPKQYDSMPEVAGHTVVFNITVLQKNVDIPAELNKEFIKANSDCKNVKEYKAAVKEELEQVKYEEDLQAAKNEMYSKIEKTVAMKQFPEDIVEKLRSDTDARYRKIAEDYNTPWDEFREQVFATDEDNYQIQLIQYSREMIKQEMIIYVMAEREGIEITKEEYEVFVAETLENTGYKSEEAFMQYAGMPIREYIVVNKVDLNLLLGKVLDKVYEDLLNK